MTQQIVNVGSVAGDGTGDDGQVPFNKTNANFTELYGTAFYFGVDSGTAGAYVITTASLKPNPTGYTLATGTIVRFTPLNANPGAATLQFASAPAIAVVNTIGGPLVGGEFSPATPTLLEYNGTAWQLLSSNTQASIGAAFYPRTPNEIAASVTPTNYVYPPGDLRRYGADPTGTTPSDAAVSAACSCNADVFDANPGGGTYLFNTGVTLSTYPITIRGQAKNNKDAVTNVGTIFRLGTAAPNAAAILSGAYLDGLNVRNIGFQFASSAGTYSQYGIHIGTGVSGGQLRSSIIENCAFVGGGALDTNIGIQIDTATGGGKYSAFNVIRSNYFSGINAGINLTGTATPNMIIANTFLGYTGASSAVAGNGLYVDSPAAEIKAIANYFEGWVNGIYVNGGNNVQQVANDFQVCTHGFNWAAPGSGVMLNQSIGDTGVAGTITGYTNLDASQVNTVGRLGWLATGAPIQSTRGFQEGSGSGSNLRTALLGYHTTPSSPTMTANGGGTISAQTTNTWSYTLIGGTMLLDFNITATLTGAGSSVLSVPIPASLTSIVQCQTACSITNNSGVVVGTAYIAASATALNFALIGAGDFTAGTVGASGQIMIRIVS